MTQQLFKFQRDAVEQFAQYSECLLGDDMGLGKTVQGIALDKMRRELQRAEFQAKYKGKAMTLVVAPLSTLGGWANHFKDWQPELRVEVIDTKNRPAFVKSFQAGKADVYICHWDSLRLMPELRKVFWFHVIGDEIHRIKNRKAQLTVALKGIPTAHKLGMSGTPADNRPDDFWSVLNWVFPKLFPSYWPFYREHVLFQRHADGTQCCEKRHKRPYIEILGTHNVDAIHKAMGGRYIRRLKEEVALDLPEKYYTRIEVDLSPQQRRAYEQMRLHMLAWIGKHENDPVAAPVVIAQLIRLQQFACAYGQIETVRYSTSQGCGKSENEVHSRPGTEDVPWAGMCKRCGEVIEREKDVLRLTDPSTKIDAVMELIEDNPDGSFVVFGQSKQVANLLAERLHSRGISVALLTGDTPAGSRTGIIEDFQAGRRRVFVGTIAAGGTGITLTRASTVIFIDRAWSPSANRQAEDRLHRIGQTNAVQVIDLVAKDTIDAERIQKIELKWEWLRQILGDKK